MKEEKVKVLVACSGGPDSMALLDMAKSKYDVYVAHVNYHQRATAKRDEKIVEDYCLKHELPFFKKDFDNKKRGGNFQDQARVFRYQFFAEIVKEYNLSCVLVAHQLDDLIETYLMQVKRNSIVDYYGLKEEIEIQGVTIKRPLLKYSKKDLLDYCLDNKLDYGIDESNLTDHYTRNQIRHSIIDKLTKEDKKKYIDEIKKKNKEQVEKTNKVKQLLNGRKKIRVDEFLNFEEPELLLNILIGINISNGQIKEIIKEINEGHKFDILINDRYLCHEYGYLEVYPKVEDYCYYFEALETFKCQYFELTDGGNSKQAVTLSVDDFPIMVRNYKVGDYIEMLYGKKKINRFFIDNKISSRQRKTWPLMFNKKGSAILVPKIGCDRYHYSQKPNMYMIEL